jgi:hypothetical protein
VVDVESRAAWADLLATLAEVGDRYAGEEWGLTDPTDVAEGLRVVLHHLGTGIETQLEQDAAHPTLRPITTPWRKALGDNADAIYHDARVDPLGTYRLRGRTAGATYVSITVEARGGGGRLPHRHRRRPQRHRLRRGRRRELRGHRGRALARR